MSIGVVKAEDKITIVLGETFDVSSVGQFRKAYESLKDQGSKKLEIDFQQTCYIDSSALGMLINAKSYLDPQHIKITLVNANEQIKKIFSISRFDIRFEIR